MTDASSKNPADSRNQENKNRLRYTGRLLLVVLIVLLLAFSALTAVRILALHNPKQPQALSDREQTELSKTLDTQYPERKRLLRNLPYKTEPASLDIAAQAAILIDTADGSILYQKNADEEIPPASMTKLVVMYIVLEDVKQGKLSLDDKVPLPPESWAVNMPSDASLMFLAEGQKVTLRELLQGLDVDSGNDAAVAIALYVSGSMEKFVDRMNSEVQALGLTHTHFVESSGYSEKNITTPRDFAAFSRIYLNRFPKVLSEFHSLRSFTYPKAQNLPDWQAQQGDGQAITQYNTNKLLGILPGCDGLKTGFIYESGFNLALTAQRKGTRFLSVTMKGPGSGSTEGNKYRIHDGTELMEWAFSNFAEYAAVPGSDRTYSYVVPVTGGKKTSVRIIPAEQTAALTVPFIQGADPQDAAAQVTVTAEIPSYIDGGSLQGTAYGTLVYKLGTTELQRIPLVADRSIQKAGWIIRASDRIAALTMKK
ncbi:MAG: D-alanyl-D-alanine carboxypeptidase [Treponema sp.]|jgi:D-alanyl-D-alanine carboxypeptidase (penicillin-binding protein 5/6)|nr:D-alanyl-D-alanine carboxypeptidase [Treponema sp.]